MPLAPRRISRFPLGLWLLASALAACGPAPGPQAARPDGLASAPRAGALAAVSPAPAGSSSPAESPSPSASSSASPLPGAISGEWVAFTSNRGVGLVPKADRKSTRLNSSHT